MIGNETAALEREAERVIRELRRADRGKRLSTPPGDSPADAAHRFAQLLADAGASANSAPTRVVPRLADHAVADQVAVTARELADAMRAGSAVDIEPLRVAAAAVRARLAGG